MAEDKIMDRVRALLNVAEHPNTPEAEAETALNMANRLITKHAIDEAILRSTQSEDERRKPSKSTIRMASGTSEFLPMLRTILAEIARANRCSIAQTYYESDIYGADEDVAWVEILFNSIYFQFVGQVNPKWDTNLTYDQNVYNLKVAGKKWGEINRLAVDAGEKDARVFEEYMCYSEAGADAQIANAGALNKRKREGDNDYWYVDYPTDKIKGTMIAAYKRDAKRRGDTEVVKTGNHIAYRLSFADAFETRLRRRIREWAADSKEQMDTIPGAALVMVSMAEEAKKLLWQDHPEMSPEYTAAQRAQAEADQKAREEMLAAMTPKQRHDFLEKEQREWDRANKRRERNTRYHRTDSSAYSRGQKAADKVNLARNAGAAKASSSRAELS